MRRQEQRHMNFVGFDIATVQNLVSDEPSDPTLEQAFQNLRKHNPQNAYQNNFPYFFPYASVNGWLIVVKSGVQMFDKHICFAVKC